jgi:7,8-dihydropterin-6-yl-methyl-4-(beta-D-ribofuranosyl)aminobenzene 5'-phosphate synthase
MFIEQRGVDRVVVTTVVENFVDIVLRDDPPVRRKGIVPHFDPKQEAVIGENAIAFHIHVEWDYYAYDLLFDTGLTGDVLLHNARALGIPLERLDHVAISHGHPDHYGGLQKLLAARETPLPVSVHPDAFKPRYLRWESGEVSPYYNHPFTREKVVEAGGSLVEHTGALEIGPSLLATGQIPREVDFESGQPQIGAPNASNQITDGELGPDLVLDEQAIVVKVRDQGIVVVMGCGHPGAVNTLEYAMKLTETERVLGVFGGFHLGFPGVPDSKVEQTISAISDMGIPVVSPMHCTGMPVIMRFAQALPDSFVLNSAGTQVSFGQPRLDGGNGVSLSSAAGVPAAV